MLMTVAFRENRTYVPLLVLLENVKWVNAGISRKDGWLIAVLRMLLCQVDMMPSTRPGMNIAAAGNTKKKLVPELETHMKCEHVASTTTLPRKAKPQEKKRETNRVVANPPSAPSSAMIRQGPTFSTFESPKAALKIELPKET